MTTCVIFDDDDDSNLFLVICVVATTEKGMIKTWRNPSAKKPLRKSFESCERSVDDDEDDERKLLSRMYSKYRRYNASLIAVPAAKTGRPVKKYLNLLLRNSCDTVMTDDEHDLGCDRTVVNTTVNGCINVVRVAARIEMKKTNLIGSSELNVRVRDEEECSFLFSI